MLLLDKTLTKSNLGQKEFISSYSLRYFMKVVGKGAGGGNRSRDLVGLACWFIYCVQLRELSYTTQGYLLVGWALLYQ